MEEKDAQDTITIHSAEPGTLPLSQMNQTPNKDSKQKNDCNRTDKTLFFTYRTEDEIGILFGYIFQFCLRTVQESFS